MVEPMGPQLSDERGVRSPAPDVLHVITPRHRALAAEARRAVEDRYDWSSIAAAMEDEYRTALARCDPRTK